MGLRDALFAGRRPLLIDQSLPKTLGNPRRAPEFSSACAIVKCSPAIIGFGVSAMARSEEEYLLELASKNICPYCGKPIPEGKRIGAGANRKGVFCSLDCYARYYEQELKLRAQRVAELAERHRKS